VFIGVSTTDKGATMFWIRSGLHSISLSDWLTAGPMVVGDTTGALADVRDAMLDVLGTAGERKFAALALRIRQAEDALSLWALRPDLMTAACRLYGEAEGRRRLADLSPHFEALVPGASGSRARGSRDALGRR